MIKADESIHTGVLDFTVCSSTCDYLTFILLVQHSVKGYLHLREPRQQLPSPSSEIGVSAFSTSWQSFGALLWFPSSSGALQIR